MFVFFEMGGHVLGSCVASRPGFISRAAQVHRFPMGLAELARESECPSSTKDELERKPIIYPDTNCSWTRIWNYLHKSHILDTMQS